MSTCQSIKASVGNRRQEFTIDNRKSLNRLIIDSTIENHGTSMYILMADFLFISELFNGLDPTIDY